MATEKINHTKRKIIFDVGHPAHVHLFRNAIGILAEIGCEIKIVARPQEITLDLLRAYNLEYESLKHYKGLINKAIGMFRIDLELKGNLVKQIFDFYQIQDLWYEQNEADLKTEMSK